MGRRGARLKKDVKSNASALHRKVFELTKECFPDEAILQEESIKIDGKTLFLDIYLPKMKVAIECDGIQHSKFTALFHTDAMSFQRQKNNDRLKEEYCKTTGITLIRISYDETITKESLKDKVLNKIKEENE